MRVYQPDAAPLTPPPCTAAGTELIFGSILNCLIDHWPKQMKNTCEGMNASCE